MSQTMGFVSTYLAAPFTLECGAQPQSPPQLSPLFPLSDPWSHCSPGSRIPFPIHMLVCSQINFCRFHHPMYLAEERMSLAHTTLVCNGCAVRWARVAKCSIEFPSIVALSPFASSMIPSPQYPLKKGQWTFLRGLREKLTRACILLNSQSHMHHLVNPRQTIESQQKCPQVIG